VTSPDVFGWLLGMAVFGSSISGEILEMAAVTCEYPEYAPWDLTDVDRRKDYVIEDRVMRHPPYWLYLPVVAFTVSYNWGHCDCWYVQGYTD
jgi:hypothetical protein